MPHAVSNHTVGISSHPSLPRTRGTRILAAGPGADAALIDIGIQFQALMRRERIVSQRFSRMVRRSRSRAERRVARGEDLFEALGSEELKIPDFHAFQKEDDKLASDLGQLADQALTLQPTTIDGLKVFALIVAWYFDPEDDNELDWGERARRRLVDAVLSSKN